MNGFLKTISADSTTRFSSHGEYCLPPRARISNGVLALSPTLIDELDLEQTSREQYMTASGAMHFTGVYEAAVVFGEQRWVIDEIVEAAEPIVGVGLLWAFEVCLEYRGGGDITLEAL